MVPSTHNSHALERDSATLAPPLPDTEQYRCGEIYIFNAADADCPADSGLWGMFDCSDHGQIYLETSSSDLESFRLHRHKLPAKYRFCRHSTRDELKLYAAASARFESLRHLPE